MAIFIFTCFNETMRIAPINTTGFKALITIYNFDSDKEAKYIKQFNDARMYKVNNSGEFFADDAYCLTQDALLEELRLPHNRKPAKWDDVFKDRYDLLKLPRGVPVDEYYNLQVGKKDKRKIKK